jgi:hypothetical protein
MKDEIFLLQAPITTPTEPPMGITQLAGYLRSHGLDLTVSDFNVQFFDALMTRSSMARALSIAHRQLGALSADRLRPPGILAYVPLLQHASLEDLPERIEPAMAVFRDPSRFFDFGQYFEAARIARRAMGLVSATISPFQLDFTEVSSLLHNFDRSSDLFRAIDDFVALEENLPLEILNHLLDDLFRGRRPRVVGISITYAHQLFLGMVLARLVRTRFPEVCLALGGPLIATMANRGRRLGSFALFRDADAIAVSDGEVAFRTLVEHVLSGKAIPPTENLITYDRRTDRGGTPGIVAIDDLDALPRATFADLPLDRYWSPTPVLPLPIARGCYWDKCAFCYYGFVPDGRRATAPYRERSVDKIVEDIAFFRAEHGCTHFDFTVDLVAPTLLDRIAEALPAAGLDVKWMLETRAERSFTRERCRKLKAGGMTYAAFGLESMDQVVLDSIQKGTRASQYPAALSNFYQEGIATHAMGFFDFPTEDHQAARASLSFLRENDPNLSEVGWGRFLLDLGSQIERTPDAYGVVPLVDPQEDLAVTVRHAQACPKKTPEQSESLDRLFAEYRLASDKFSYLGRPFFTGGSLEPHCLLYFGALGPSAAVEFTRAARARVDAEIGPETRLRAVAHAQSLRHSVKDAYRLFGELGRLVGDDKAGPVASAVEREPRSRRLERFRDCGKDLELGEERQVIASPEQISEIGEAQAEILAAFHEPATVGSLLELYPEQEARILAFLSKAVAYGWLELVCDISPAPSSRAV